MSGPGNWCFNPGQAGWIPRLTSLESPAGNDFSPPSRLGNYSCLCCQMNHVLYCQSYPITWSGKSQVLAGLKADSQDDIGFVQFYKTNIKDKLKNMT